MLEIARKTKAVVGVQPDSIPAEILSSAEPVILKGLVKSWPLVAAGLGSNRAADDYLKKFYNGKTVGVFLGSPEIKGRFFYNDDLTKLNFENQRLPLDLVVEQILQHEADPHPPAIYVGSTTIDACLPGFRSENELVISNQDAVVSIWIGNRSRIACHYDAPDNIACVAVGKRRFTLFPPDQIANLYPGPLDFTPAGQTISLVDFESPDFDSFPRFKTAISNAQVADLEPGDALFLPGMWWHHVEALSAFNILVNYWWRAVPAHMGPAINALKHAMLSIRDLPEKENSAWKHIFDYYIFGSSESVKEHIPDTVQGFLGPIDDIKSRQLRAWLVNKLNR